MARADANIAAVESRLARRVCRLFQMDRTGVLARRGANLAGRLRDRRGQLIALLIQTDKTRRNLEIPISPELQHAAEALWRETNSLHDGVQAELERLQIDLSLVRGAGRPTGIRNATAGRVIARG